MNYWWKTVFLANAHVYSGSNLARRPAGYYWYLFPLSKTIGRDGQAPAYMYNEQATLRLATISGSILAFIGQVDSNFLSIAYDLRLYYRLYSYLNIPYVSFPDS